MATLSSWDVLWIIYDYIDAMHRQHNFINPYGDDSNPSIQCSIDNANVAGDLEFA